MLESNYTYDLLACFRRNLTIRMAENNEKSKLLLFLSSENEEYGRAANSVFETEAKRMDVIWTSQSKVLSANSESDADNLASLHDVQKADLVILLLKPGSNTQLKSHFAGWNGKHDVWEISDAENLERVVKQNVESLLVRLILQGGKRKPLPGQGASNQVHGVNIAQAGKQSDTALSKDSVRVSRESKGRRGKTVTIISGLTLDDAKLQDLATRLKQICGTGGTVKDGKIEIQGDQCDRILAELQSRGYKAKRSGG